MNAHFIIHPSTTAQTHLDPSTAAVTLVMIKLVTTAMVNVGLQNAIA